MEVDEKEAKKKNMVVKMHGNEFFFCCDKCKKEFLDNPTVYPDHCAYCMNKCDLSQTIWKIKHKDVIYCFCSKECKEEFESKQFGKVSR
jgi:YHS domain-containing protein